MFLDIGPYDNFLKHFWITGSVPTQNWLSKNVYRKSVVFLALTFEFSIFFSKFLQDRQIEGKCRLIKQKLGQLGQKHKCYSTHRKCQKMMSKHHIIVLSRFWNFRMFWQFSKNFNPNHKLGTKECNRDRCMWGVFK